MTRPITDAEFDRFCKSVEGSLARIEAAVERSEEQWRERTHELADNIHGQAVKIALQDREIRGLKATATAIASGIGLGLHAVVEFFKR